MKTIKQMQLEYELFKQTGTPLPPRPALNSRAPNATAEEIRPWHDKPSFWTPLSRKEREYVFEQALKNGVIPHALVRRMALSYAMQTAFKAKDQEAFDTALESLKRGKGPEPDKEKGKK